LRKKNFNFLRIFWENEGCVCLQKELIGLEKWGIFYEKKKQKGKKKLQFFEYLIWEMRVVYTDQSTYGYGKCVF